MGVCECHVTFGRIVEFGARPLVAGATLLSGLQCGTHGDGASMAASRDLFWEFGGWVERKLKAWGLRFGFHEHDGQWWIVQVGLLV